MGGRWVRWCVVLAGAASAASLAGCGDSTTPKAHPSSSSASSSSSAAASPTGSSAGKVSLRLTAGTSMNIRVGTPRRMQLTVRNLTGERLDHLQLATSNTVGGSPGAAVEQWNPSFAGPCGAAAGTSYCPLPSVPPHGTFRATVTAVVPASLGGHSTAGLDFVQTVFLTSKNGASPMGGGYRRVHLHVVD